VQDENSYAFLLLLCSVIRRNISCKIILHFIGISFHFSVCPILFSSLIPSFVVSSGQTINELNLSLNASPVFVFLTYLHGTT